jgi:hypothetical protein
MMQSSETCTVTPGARTRTQKQVQRTKGAQSSTTVMGGVAARGCTGEPPLRLPGSKYLQAQGHNDVRVTGT